MILARQPDDPLCPLTGQIAGLIGAGGLGAVVTSGLYSNPALAILAGLAIVIMAMTLDRSTEAVAERTDPAVRHIDESRRRRGLRALALVATIAVGVGISKALGVAAVYPDEAGNPPRTVTIQEWLLTKIQVVLDYVQDPTTWVFAITERVGVFILQQLLLPLQAFLVEAPWFTTALGLTAIAFVVSGLRPALTTLAMLCLIGFLGVWALAMDTLSQVLVATAIAVVLGVALGVLAAESNRFSKAMRPVNDLLQTLPPRLHHPVHLPGCRSRSCRDRQGSSTRSPVTLRLVERGAGRRADVGRGGERVGALRRQVLMRSASRLGDGGHASGINQAIIMVLAVAVTPGSWVRAARLRGRAGRPRPRAVRSGRDRLDRDPRAWNRA
jgi:glycine betaine/proline transport system permease protein